MKKYERFIIKSIQVLLFILSILFFLAPLIYYLRESTRGMLHELSYLTPAEWAAMAFNLSALLLLGLSTRRPGDKYGYLDPPDVSPAELLRQIRISGSRLFRRSLKSLRSPAKQAKHKHSEII